MNIQVDEFIKLEDNSQIFEDDINGFKYWQYIRFILFGIVNDLTNDYYTRENNRIVSFSLLKRMYYSFKSSPYRKKGNIDCLCLCTQRKSLVNGEYVDLYTTDVYKYISEKFNSLIVDYDVKYLYENPYYEHTLNGIMNNISLKQVIFKPFIINKDIKKQINEKSRKIVDLIINDYSIDKDYDSFCNEVNSIITTQYLFHKCAKPSFERLIKKKNIKFISLVCHYSLFKMVLLEVANEKHVETLEFQHGIMGDGHIAYNFHNNSPIFFPKNILLFSEYWKQTTNFPKGCNLYMTGYPFLEHYKNSTTIAKQNSIVFISQGVYSKGLYSFANEVYNYFEKNGKSINIIFKLHPIESKNDYKPNPNIKIIDGRANIYDLFLISNMQIGVYSTAIYEGLAFDLITLIYKINDSASRMEYLVDNNYAEYVTNAEQVYKAYYNNELVESTNSFYECDSYAKTITTVSEIILNKK